MPRVDRKPFGTLPDGTVIEEFTLDSGSGLIVSVLSLGGIVRSVRFPDRGGELSEVTLGFDTLDEYLAGHPYYGSFVGRYANRISGGGFSVDGTFYDLPLNHGSLQLHGGEPGFHAVAYEASVIEADGRVGVELTRRSPDGESGYPGNLRVTHRVIATGASQLLFEFEAETDQACPVNLTNHTYWNLGRESTILDHWLCVPADSYAEASPDEVLTGRLLPVEGTAFDFRTGKTVGKDIDQVKADGELGYDHSYLINGWDEGKPGVMIEAARVRCDETGREMVVRTTYPDVHVYSGNHLAGARGRAGETLVGQEALCLECQYFADGPNRPEFPSTVLRPGERYAHRTEHVFRTYP